MGAFAPPIFLLAVALALFYPHIPHLYGLSTLRNYGHCTLSDTTGYMGLCDSAWKQTSTQSTTATGLSSPFELGDKEEVLEHSPL